MPLPKKISYSLVIVSKGDSRVDPFLQTLDPEQRRYFEGIWWKPVGYIALALSDNANGNGALPVIGIATLGNEDETGTKTPTILHFYVVPVEREQGIEEALLVRLAERSQVTYSCPATVNPCSKIELGICRKAKLRAESALKIVDFTMS